MTGNPLIRLALVLVALLALAYPIARLTSEPSVPTATANTSADDPESHSIVLTVTTTAIPSHLEIFLPGEATTTLTPTDPTTEVPLTLPASSNGWDLILRATWADAIPHALRVSTTSVDETFWAEADLEEVLTIPPPSSP